MHVAVIMYSLCITERNGIKRRLKEIRKTYRVIQIDNTFCIVSEC